MADGTIKIDTEIDSSGVNSGLKDIGKTVKSLGKGLAIGGAATVAVKALQGVTKELGKCVDLYKVQAKAEKQLEVAAKNNPYLSSESVKELKNFAGELQNISTVGDEELIPMMAKLASSGRTQTEIQNIMSAALDASASGAISLDSAVTSLNASYSGQLGLLSRQLPQLKSLTTEELKNGKAVEEVAKAFKGMSKEVSDDVGSAEKLKNAWGDLREELGAPFQKAISPLQNFFTELISGWTNAAKARREYNEALENKKKGKSTASDTNTILTKERSELALHEQNYANYTSESYVKEKVSMGRGYVTEDQFKKLAEQEKQKIEQKKAYIKTLEEQYEAEKKSEEATKTATENAAKQAEKEKSIAEYKAENTKNLNESLAKIDAEVEARKALGEEIDEQAIAQDKLNAMIESYVSLIADSNGQVTTENWLAKERIAQINEQTQKVKDLSKEVNNIDWSGVEKVFSKVTDSVNQLLDAVTTAFDLATEGIQANASAETAIAEKQYADGLITYEEYCAKKEQIEKDAAEKTYELQMWAWGIQLLQAQASTALAMIQTLADTTIVGTGAKIAMMAVMGALGATQLATIIASKPTKNLTQGGFVGGSSYTGDTVRAGLNSGELVVNRQQQAALWRAMNGGGGGGISQSIKIENNAADSVSIGQSVSEDKLIFTVNKIVNSEMKRGTYTGSMLEANSKVNGVKYL